MDERTKNLLGRALKSHYDDLVTAPIPDRFLMLLAELEAKEVRDE
ncbi:MAG: NepR family anti-sigma factor [Hyphomicrobiales bacterium]|nr:NepR family anti-sigma factor [Hyphomicrobiales bacterium]